MGNVNVVFALRLAEVDDFISSRNRHHQWIGDGGM